MAPEEFFPRLSKKSKKKLHVRYSSHIFPLGPETLPGLLWYCGLCWLCRVNRVVVVLSTVLKVHGCIKTILGIMDVSVTTCVLQKLLNISAAESPRMVQEEAIFGRVLVALYPGKAP